MNFVYDIETMKNLFSCCIVSMETGNRWIYEVSPRKSQAARFINAIRHLRGIGARMVGFNNEGFDWWVVQNLIALGDFSALDAYNLGQQVIQSQDRFGMTIWPNERLVPQVDLYKIHHFDNKSKSTGLKKLEINMRSYNVIELPYSPHVDLTSEQMDHVIEYMCHDVSETAKFMHYSMEQVKFRDELAAKYPDIGDVVNFNDTKIGKKYFEMMMEKDKPGICYTRESGRRKPRQTRREEIRMTDVISPKVAFTEPAFQRVTEWLRQQVLTRAMIDETLSDKVETKGVLTGLNAVVNGFQFDFGTGGIHGSLHRQVIRESDQDEIVDVDVASFYPNLAISNRWYPEHLGESFCTSYEQVYEMRKGYGKKTVENAMLKLALNGVYGDSNSIYGPFYDPQYTMKITVNGQLFLCMLAEWLMADGHRIIQANTDGVTLLVNRAKRPSFDAICKRWETYTGLDLEAVNYKMMAIRDVNNYIAVKMDGSVKRIGAYAHETPLENPYTRELGWHKDHSQRVVMMAAEAQIVRSVPVEDFIRSHRDPFNFMKSIKVPKSSRLEADGHPIQNTTRYYVSTDGVTLKKIMPGLKDGPERDFAVEKGWTVTVVNDASRFDWSTVNWLYYVEEARKLLI